MRGMPPMHFDVKLAIPTVCGEACLLRWRRARALNCGEILRQDNPTLQFRRASISAFRQLDCCTAAPEIVPVVTALAKGSRDSWQGRLRQTRRESHDESRSCFF